MMKILQSTGGRAMLVVAALAAVACLAVAVLAPRTAGALSPPRTGYIQVSAGWGHTCAVTESGKLACWGDNSSSQTDVWGWQYQQVSTGALHTCAIAESGELECWGGRYYERRTDEDQGIDCLGEGCPDLAFAPSGRYQQVSVGGAHTCAVAESGKLACWGYNRFGQVFAPSGQYRQVSAGELHTCAVAESGELACWGYSWFSPARRTRPAGQYRQVSAGRSHTCAVAESGELACWGDNENGQADAPSGRYRQVSVGGWHTCAVAESGELACWGNNNSGQTDSPAGRYRQVSAGGSHTCAVAESGELACWGNNSSGQTDVPLSYNPGSTQLPVGTPGRIVARQLNDGRTEFAWHVEDGERVLPRLRYLPAEPPIGRWLNSSDIVVEGVTVGRINVRVKAGDRPLIEFAFTPAGGERILPRLRYFSFSNGTMTDVWLRSSLIEPGG